MPDTLFIIDAYAQIYRGFYAVRYLSNSRGEPTNAVFAMAKFLLKMHKEFPGELGAFVFDVGKPSFRMELAPDYKANRAPMPDELRAQIPILKELIEAFGWPEISREGYEADDLIAALAEDFGSQPVRIVSSDKDIHQVVTDNINMMVPDSKGGFDIRGPEEVRKKFEVDTCRIVDYLSLIGDASDNIPGVQGVGPKTAAKLINEVGGIDDLLTSPEKIANVKLRDKIVAAEDILRKNQKLVTLKTDVENKPWNDPAAVTRREPDWAALEKLAEHYELKSILKEIQELSGSFNDMELFSQAPSTKETKPEPEDKPDQPDLFGGF